MRQTDRVQIIYALVAAFAVVYRMEVLRDIANYLLIFGLRDIANGWSPVSLRLVGDGIRRMPSSYKVDGNIALKRYCQREPVTRRIWSFGSHLAGVMLAV